MSGALTTAIAVASQAIPTLTSILIRPYRALGPLVADVVVEEEHYDELAITEHPVELGAAITDHAYKRPAEVVLRLGWSNSASDAISGLISTFLGEGESRVRDVYQDILTLQMQRVPFSITTGKRSYQRMLIASVETRTDREREYILDVRVRCRQIIIVQTYSATLPPMANQANPQATASPINAGQKQIKQVPESILYQAYH